MMGICKSCFGGGKYLGQSPVQDSFLEADAQKLLPKKKDAASIVSREPSESISQVKPLIKTECGDSGTCVDEMSELRGASLSRSDELEDGSGEDEPQDGSGDEPQDEVEVDQVQLTVSSVGSLGGVLEDVPEHCELGADDENPDPADYERIDVLVHEAATLAAKPTPKVRHHSFGSRTILAANPNEGRRQFTIHKVNSKSLLISGVKYEGSRQSSRNSSISGPSKSSLPSSRGPSRPPSKPASRTSSRAPSPSRPGSKPGSRPGSRAPSPSRPGSKPPSRSSSRAPSPKPHSRSSSRNPSPDRELANEIKPKTRFSIIGVEVPLKKVRSSSREKSPLVSFKEDSEVYDFQERQYQTVHAGCEINVKPTFRDRSRSGRFSRDGRKNATGSRPSIIDWPIGKFSWLKDRQKTNTKGAVGKPDAGGSSKEGELCISEENAAEDLSPKSRPRSKSDRFSRPSRRQVVDVYKQAAFDWPLGQIGKIKQKYQKSKSTSRSKSDANIAANGVNPRILKRRSSERHGKSRKVAFEDQRSVPWWNYPIKLMKNATSTSSTTNTKKKRRRHSTDPESRGRGGLEPETRRRTASLSTPHRASDVQVDPAHSAILFRDARGLPASDPFLTYYTFQTLKNDESQIFVKFFGFHKCYDLIPTSAKLVVFDTQLLVKKAFFALVYNGVRAAPLWDSVEQRFVGMLTITDFIRILSMNYRSPTLEMEELEEHRLATWRNVLHDAKELIYIDPDASLYEAIRTLIHNKIHRLPVIDGSTGNVLYILTHKRILRFLFLYIGDLPQSSELHQSIVDLQIGTYNDIEVAYEDTPIIDALHKFVNKRVSALPIVDEQRRLIDIYAKFDVINLAAEKTYSNLDVTLKEANQHRNEWFEGVHKCKQTESLYEVMERIVKAEVHRLVIVDDDNVVVGVISLSDILTYLVLRPGGDDLKNPPVKDIVKTEAEVEAEVEVFVEKEKVGDFEFEKEKSDVVDGPSPSPSSTSSRSDNHLFEAECAKSLRDTVDPEAGCDHGAATPEEDKPLVSPPPSPPLSPPPQHSDGQVAGDLGSLTGSSSSSLPSPATSEPSLRPADVLSPPTHTPSPDPIKELVKSDSTDSAFEATEQFEEETREDIKVHIEIVDLTHKDLEDRLESKVADDCDNVERLSELKSCEGEKKDVSIQ